MRRSEGKSIEMSNSGCSDGDRDEKVSIELTSELVSFIVMSSAFRGAALQGAVTIEGQSSGASDVGLPGCRVAGLPGGRVAGLSGCQEADEIQSVLEVLDKLISSLL